MRTCYLLTGDIGGTNSRMSLYESNRDQAVVVKIFRNSEHLPEAVLGESGAFSKYIVDPFLAHCWKACQSLVRLDECDIIACLAIAGVVSDNTVRLTNLGNLLVDGHAMAKNETTPYLRAVKRCRIINDFVAQGYGCLTLKPNEVQHLYGPKITNFATVTGPKICVGAGTGLGECYLTPNDHHTEYTCFPSEGGHVEYAPRDELEVEMFQYLSHKFASKGRISVERVVSGKGLANVYEFLAQRFPDKVDKTMHAEFVKAGDEQGKVVGQDAYKHRNLEKDATLSRKALCHMMGAYGCEVGSAAIKWIPTGGLFVTGGLTPKNISFIAQKEGEFMSSYLHKGRVSPLLNSLPLYAVLVEDIGIRGAHHAATMDYQRYKAEQQHGPKKSDIQLLSWVAIAAAIGFTAGVSLKNGSIRS